MATVVRQLLRPVPDEAAETNTEHRQSREFLMILTFSILGAVIEARGNGCGTGTDPHRFLDFSLVAIVFSLASSSLHLRLHRLPLAHLFLHLAAFFTATAVGLLIASCISPSMLWMPFVALLVLGCLELLYCVTALWRFVVFHIGPTADDVEMQSSSNQLSRTSIDHEQPVHLHGEINETAAPRISLSSEGWEDQRQPSILHTPHEIT